MAVIWFALFFILRIISSFMQYNYVSKTLDEKIASPIDLIDVFCSSGGVINTYIRNVGTESVAISDLKFYINGTETSSSGCLGDIKSGGIATCQVGSGLTGNYDLRIKGPSNTVQKYINCG